MSALLNPTSTTPYREATAHTDSHTPAAQDPEIAGPAPEHRQTPKELAVAETVAAGEPAKKRLASHQVSMLPQTLLPASPVSDTTTKPTPRKSRVTIPLVAVII